uniref:Uncharacterized protein n=1 Tax=Arundo donax TaxID=35708 RepID=A0A0A9A3F1_ARUDO
MVDVGAILKSLDVVSLADGVNVVYLGTNYAYVTIDLKSMRVRKVGEVNGFDDIVPYMSFHTLGTTLLNFLFPSVCNE